MIVCDGFTGNVILKMAEGLYRINNALGGNNNKFWEAMNYEHVGGTPVLGVGAPVIIGHGCSSPLAIRSMILSTEHSGRAASPCSTVRRTQAAALNSRITPLPTTS